MVSFDQYLDSVSFADMAGLARKRQIEEVDRLDLLTKPIANAKLHGALTSLSSVKKGRNANYFDGTLYDGYRQVRLVGFLPAQQKKLDGFSTSKKAVAFQNCEVKPSRQGGEEMEIILKTSTEIVESPRSLDPTVFTVSDPETNKISLSDIGLVSTYQKVIVDVKVMSVMEPVDVSGGKRKQEVVVGDHTGSCKVTLWEEHVGSLVLESSYRLKNFFVREYAAQKYLSMPRAGGVIVAIEDIGEIPESAFADVTVSTICDVEIIGVPALDCYRACLKCKARVEPLSPKLGKCSKSGCAMMQRYDKCSKQLSAKLMVTWIDDEGETRTQSLFAYGRIVSGLAGIDDADADDLVSNESFLSASTIPSITYNENNVITAFTR